MSYGLRIWGADGALQMDESSFTMRVVLSVLVTFSGAGPSQSFSVPGCTPNNCIAVVVPIGAYTNGDGLQIQFEPEVLTGSVRVWRGHRTAYDGLYGVGTQRLIVARFK
jgi:hypothetical protein